MAVERRGRLEGKVALDTGTTGGQGREAALLFARETEEMVRAQGSEIGAT